ncbi:oligosaccharide flippase family protein, partial [Klebsiella quasipneumoniae]|uniref:oligosaccharide flippase family protein n=1 Tax=Klebsiella quasipneumoniae TaxID=1463165 RepID=UPI0035A21D7D
MDKKIVKNSFWMMSEKVISIFGLIFVTAYVAKYVGPGVFGQISFSMSVFQITQIIAQLGSSVIIFKRISKKKNSGVILINATVFIRIIFYMLFSLPVVFYFNNSFWFVFAAFLACFFSSLDVYSIYYDATLKSKTNAMVNMFGLIVSLTLRWLIVRMEMDPIYITIPMVLTSLIPYVMRAFSYRENFKVTPSLT